MTKPIDYPLLECLETMNLLVLKGVTVYQKWTCEKCGDRVTANKPNTITRHGHHEECGHVTDLSVKGCNYMAIGPSDVMLDVVKGKTCKTHH
jgi:hypothetical protein